MFCGSCGKKIEDGDRFCAFCGAPVPASDPAPSGVSAQLGAVPGTPKNGVNVPSYAAPGAQSVPARKNAAGKTKFTAGGALLLAALATFCLPYVLKSLIFLSKQGSIGNVLSMICGVIGYAAAGVALLIASKRISGKWQFSNVVLFVGLLAADDVIQPFLLDKMSFQKEASGFVYLIIALVLRAALAAIAVVPLSGMFSDKGKCRQGGKIKAFIMSLLAFFAPELFSFLWDLLPFSQASSFASTLAYRMICALLTAFFFELAVKVLLKKRGEEKSSGKFKLPIGLAAGGALLAAAFIVSLISVGSLTTAEVAVDDISQNIVLGDVYLSYGDMPSATSAFDAAGEHYNAWKTVAEGGRYYIPDWYRTDSVLKYLSYLESDAESFGRDLVTGLEREEAPMWLELLKEKYGSDEEFTDNESAHVRELVDICIAEERFVFSYPTLEEIRENKEEILEYLGEGYPYEKEYRIARAFGNGQLGSGASSAIEELLDLAEKNPDDVSLQFAAAYFGSENTWDNARHYERTSDAVVRFYDLWEKEYGEDASDEDIRKSCVGCADMLLNMKQYERAAEFLEDALERAPDDIEIKQKLSNCYIELDDTERGYRLAKEIFEDDQEDVTILRTYCIGALKNGESEEAIKAASALADVVLNDNDGDIEGDLLLFNCVTYLTVSDSASWTDFQYRIYDGEDTDEDLMRLFKKNDFLYNYVNAVYYQRNKQDSEAALPFVEKALSMQEGSGRLWYLKGAVYLDLERFKDAKAAYMKADEITPNDPSIMFALANTLDALEEYEQAYSLCKQILAQFPNGVDHGDDHYGVSYHVNSLYSKLDRYMKEEGNK